MDERVFPSLGILKVASVLEEKGYHVELLDLSGVNNYLEVVETYIENSSCQYFGITATTPQVPAATKIAKTIRNFSRKTILGGPHITLINAASKIENKNKIVGRATKEFRRLYAEYDYLIAGDGEYAILEWFRTKDKFIDADLPKTDLFLKNDDLEKLPFPARHLLDMSSYKFSVDDKPATSLIAQLGCPFSCFFCAGRDTPFLRRIRTRSSENIIQEMEHIYNRYNISSYMMHDDELNVNKSMVDLMYKISDLSSKLGTEFKLRGFIKSELFNDEQAKAMYAAGFRILLIGFESGNDRILKNIRKNATRDDNTRAMEIADRNGLKIKALMSIGHSGESEQTVRDTEEWLLEVKPFDFDVTVISPYPGSPYFDRAKKIGNDWVFTDPKNNDKLYMGEIDYATKANYYKGIPGSYVSYVWTDYLSRENLCTLRDETENNVRKKLGISFNQARSGIQYEHSMGQTAIPATILRTTDDK